MVVWSVPARLEVPEAFFLAVSNLYSDDKFKETGS